MTAKQIWQPGCDCYKPHHYRQLPADAGCYAGDMAFSRERILDALARLPFIDAGELALILGEPLATVHRAMTGLLKDGLAKQVSHGTAQLPAGIG